MKRIFTVGVALAALFFASCEPNEDIYDKLDDAKEPYKKTISYTLSAADYTVASNAALVDALNLVDSTIAENIGTNQAFNTRFPAVDYMRFVLDKNFPVLKKGSAAILTYNEMLNSSDIEHLLAIDTMYKVELAGSDYSDFGAELAAAKCFTPSQQPDVFLPDFISKKVPNDFQNLALVTYRKSEFELYPDGSFPTADIKTFNEDFESFADKANITTNGWEIKLDNGSVNWQARTYSGNRYAQISAYGAPGDVVTYLVSPEISLSDININRFSFDVKVRFYNADCLQILYTDDFKENFADTKWTDITSSFTLPTAEADFASAGVHNFAAEKKNIRIAFKYTGKGIDPVATTTVQIDNISIFCVQPVAKDYNDFYQKDETGNTWKRSESFIAVHDFEYELMGLSGGFSENKPSSDYLPIYLERRLPYSKEGDELIVAYKMNGSLTADSYVFNNGEWNARATGNTVTKTAQYVHNGVKWVFDPTVTFTMSKPDYQLIVDWVKDVLNRPELIDRGNAEFYAGASAYYGNYDIRISKRAQWDPDTYSNLTDDEANALIWNRLNESLVVMLQKKFPNAVAQVSGVEVFYNVSFIVFDGISKTYTAKFQCTADGSESVAPTFELISGPAVL